MKILNIQSVEGPNEWSAIYDQLVVLDLEICSPAINSDKERAAVLSELEMHFPSMIDYESGGLKKSAVSGTGEAFIALLVELIAHELHTLAGMKAHFSDTYILHEEVPVFRIVFSYERKEAGLRTAKAAVDIVHALINRRAFDLSISLNDIIRLHHNVQVQVEKAA